MVVIFYYNFFLAYNFFDWKSEIVTQPGLISKGLKIQGSGFFCGLNIKRSLKKAGLKNADTASLLLAAKKIAPILVRRFTYRKWALAMRHLA